METTENSSNSSSLKTIFAVVLSLLLLGLTTLMIVLMTKNEDTDTIKTFQYVEKIDGRNNYTLDVEMNLTNNSYRYKFSSPYDVYKQEAITDSEIESEDIGNYTYNNHKYDESYKVNVKDEFTNWMISSSDEIKFDQTDFFLDINHNGYFLEEVIDHSTDKHTSIDERFKEEQFFQATLNFNEQSFIVDDTSEKNIKSFEYVQTINNAIAYVIDVEMNVTTNSYRYKVTSLVDIYNKKADDGNIQGKSLSFNDKIFFYLKYDEKEIVTFNSEFSEWKESDKDILYYDQDDFFIDINKDNSYQEHILNKITKKTMNVNQRIQEKQSLHATLNFQDQTFNVSDISTNPIKTFEYVKKTNDNIDYIVDFQVDTIVNAYRYKVSTTSTIYKEGAETETINQFIEGNLVHTQYLYDSEKEIILNEGYSQWVTSKKNVIEYNANFYIDLNDNNAYKDTILNTETHEIKKIDERSTEKQSLNATYNFSSRTLKINDEEIKL